MVTRFVLAGVGAFAWLASGCSGSKDDPGFTSDAGSSDTSTTSDAGVDLDTGSAGDDAGSFGDASGGGDTGTSGGVATIYAQTDTELYAMDPTSLAVTDIGPFQGATACSGNAAITDLAINGAGDIWVNTECALYQAALPASGTGPVTVTLKTKITGSSGQKFFALGFAPAGVLGAAEGLVAGDSLGELYYVDTATGATQDLGGFGNDANNKPWQLSGDIVFYTQNGAPLGLATIRTKSSATALDTLAEIDVAAMSAAFTSKTPGILLKKIYGTNTGYAKLFGVGAWGNDVYAFSRSGTTPAQLVKIDATGTGTLLQSFPNITAGWSGAGVTTKATITIPPPK